MALTREMQLLTLGYKFRENKDDLIEIVYKRKVIDTCAAMSSAIDLASAHNRAMKATK